MGLEKIIQKGINFVKENKNFVIAASFVTLANLADTVTTAYAFNSGQEQFLDFFYHYQHHIENYGITVFSLIKMGLGLGSLAIVYRCKSRTGMAYAAGIGLGVVAAFNSYVLLNYSGL